MSNPCMSVSRWSWQQRCCVHASAKHVQLVSVLFVLKVLFSPGALVLGAPGTPENACPHVVRRRQLLVTNQKKKSVQTSSERIIEATLGSINIQFVVVTDTVLITVR